MQNILLLCFKDVLAVHRAAFHHELHPFRLLIMRYMLRIMRMHEAYASHLKVRIILVVMVVLVVCRPQMSLSVI